MAEAILFAEVIKWSYFLVFFAVFGAAFFAVPHGPFDLQAIKILLFENSYTKISQPIRAVNRLRGPARPGLLSNCFCRKFLQRFFYKITPIKISN